MTYTNATCTAESDGYHEHTYRSGSATVTHHLHAWMDEHLAEHPDSSRVYLKLNYGRKDEAYAGTVEQAWAELTGKPLPDVDCKEAS
jgi:hypothetical protein